VFAAPEEPDVPTSAPGGLWRRGLRGDRSLGHPAPTQGAGPAAWCVSDEGARMLAACPDLKRLELLDLSRNELTEAGIAALNAVGIGVETGYQHGSTADVDIEEEPYGAHFLYEADYE